VENRDNELGKRERERERTNSVENRDNELGKRERENHVPLYL